MIDIETEVYDAVAGKLKEQFPNIYTTGEYVKAPPRFPCVSLIMMSNAALARTQTSSCMENHAQVMFEANIYSNRANTKKTECKEIAGALDEAMLGLGFTRTMLTPIPNMDDATIYRITGRYQAVASKDNVIYRR